MFKAHPDSCDIVNLAYRRMVRGKCAETDARLAEVTKEKMESVMWHLWLQVLCHKRMMNMEREITMVPSNFSKIC